MPVSYASVIALALEDKSDNRMNLREIYDFFHRHQAALPMLRRANWKHSIRHVLTSSEGFFKVRQNGTPAPPSEKYCLWTKDDSRLPPQTRAVLRYARDARLHGAAHATSLANATASGMDRLAGHVMDFINFTLGLGPAPALPAEEARDQDGGAGDSGQAAAARTAAAAAATMAAAATDDHGDDVGEAGEGVWSPLRSRVVQTARASKSRRLESSGQTTANAAPSKSPTDTGAASALGAGLTVLEPLRMAAAKRSPELLSSSLLPSAKIRRRSSLFVAPPSAVRLGEEAFGGDLDPDESFAAIGGGDARFSTANHYAYSNTPTFSSAYLPLPSSGLSAIMPVRANSASAETTPTLITMSLALGKALHDPADGAARSAQHQTTAEEARLGSAAVNSTAGRLPSTATAPSGQQQQQQHSAQSAQLLASIQPLCQAVQLPFASALLSRVLPRLQRNGMSAPVALPLLTHLPDVGVAMDLGELAADQQATVQWVTAIVQDEAQQMSQALAAQLVASAPTALAMAASAATTLAMSSLGAGRTSSEASSSLPALLDV